jgi:hypothetical protein
MLIARPFDDFSRSLVFGYRCENERFYSVPLFARDNRVRAGYDVRTGVKIKWGVPQDFYGSTDTGTIYQKCLRSFVRGSLSEPEFGGLAVESDYFLVGPSKAEVSIHSLVVKPLIRFGDLPMFHGFARLYRDRLPFFDGNSVPDIVDLEQEANAMNFAPGDVIGIASTIGLGAMRLESKIDDARFQAMALVVPSDQECYPDGDALYSFGHDVNPLGCWPCFLNCTI